MVLFVCRLIYKVIGPSFGSILGLSAVYSGFDQWSYIRRNKCRQIDQRNIPRSRRMIPGIKIDEGFSWKLCGFGDIGE
jgi:hypothetical protein